MTSRMCIVTALCALLAFPAGVQGASAPESFYAGKTVTIVVGYKPGGGYDAIARLLARHLPKHIPGKPTIIIQNMPGAGSLIAANHLYSVAKPDGLTLGTFNRNLPIAQLTKVDGVKFDLRRFAWIGSAASETIVLAVRSDLPYATFDDLRKAGALLVVGATGPGASSYDFPLLLKEILGLNVKIVSGYSSGADITLAMERKEVDARAASYSSIRPLIERGLIRPLVRGRAAEPGIDKLPVDENLAPTKRAKAIMALRSAPEVIGRPYVMPPGTPEERVAIMREAFRRVAADPELVEESRKAKMEITYIPGGEALAIIEEILSQPKDVVEEFSKYIKFGE